MKNSLQFTMLAFDSIEIMGHRKETGRPMSVPDGQIAAIARANNFHIATRNIRNFDERGVILINPFDGLT